jgi:serine/threonine protein kinase
LGQKLSQGDVICRGKYRLVRELGTGGFGVVFEAENTVTRRRVAIKSLHKEIANEEVIERLRREALAANRVRHRNVVDVYDLEHEKGAVFLVMEYLEGETLAQAMDRELRPVHEMVSLFLPLLRGLAALHKNGVVHRDIKPDNIFLAREDGSQELIPKLLDFGISKLESESPALTQAGTQGMGSLMYMSPEQCLDSRNVDQRTDVYSMGVVLYECLTGRLPYDASSLPELILKTLTTTPVPPRELRTDVSHLLDQVVLKAIERDIVARFQTIDELLNELRPFASVNTNSIALATARSDGTQVLTISPAEREWRRASPRLGSRPKQSAVWIGMLTVLLLASYWLLYWPVHAIQSGRSRDSEAVRDTELIRGSATPGAASVRASSPAVGVPIRVFCEITNVELWVDDHLLGHTRSQKPILLTVFPGLHLFEIQRNGSILVAEIAEVLTGGRDVYLRRPAGARDEALLAGAPPPRSIQGTANVPAPRSPSLPIVVQEKRRDTDSPSVAPSPITGRLTKEQLSDVVLKGRMTLQQCYDVALRRSSSATPVQLDVDIRVAPEGHVASVQTSGEALPGMEECIVRAMRQWPFPAASETTETRFSIVFRDPTAGQLNIEQTSEVVRGNLSDLKQCYKTVLGGADLTETARWDVDVQIAPSGQVTDVRAAGPAFPSMNDCIVRTVSAWQYPASATASHTRFPAIFQPGIWSRGEFWELH